MNTAFILLYAKKLNFLYVKDLLWHFLNNEANNPKYAQIKESTYNNSLDND